MSKKEVNVSKIKLVNKDGRDVRFFETVESDGSITVAAYLDGDDSPIEGTVHKIRADEVREDLFVELRADYLAEFARVDFMKLGRV